MSIQNFPAALQPAIQLGALEREFEGPLTSKLGYRQVAERMNFPNGSGETVTKTRAGLKPTAKTPLNPANNTNFDNGLTPSGWPVEQFTVTLNQYADTQDLNIVTSGVAIARLAVQNARVNGEQASRTLDELARDALFAAYMGGNTRVTQTLGSAGTTVAVDDVRGFQNVFVNGKQVPVSAGTPMAVAVNGVAASLVSVAIDGSNVSVTPNGVSGSLIFAANVAAANGTAGNAVVAATAPVVVRAGNRATCVALQAGDALLMDNLLDAKANLELNGVPTIDGYYNCYLDPMSMRQLFSDPSFKQLNQGVSGSNPAFRDSALESPMLGLRFIRTTEAFVQAHPTLTGKNIRRVIVVGKDALIEADFDDMTNPDGDQGDAVISFHDGIKQIMRPPVDRLKQIIAQSWEWIGGFCAPSDTMTNPSVLSTATNAAYKRAVMIEHIG